MPRTHLHPVRSHRKMIESKRLPVKLREKKKPQKYGAVVETVDDVLRLGCNKFRIPCAGATVCLECDGTMIDDTDYLQTLKENTCLVVLAQDQTWAGGTERIWKDLEEASSKVKKITLNNRERELIYTQPPSETSRLLVEFVDSIQGNIQAEARLDDPDWFQDINKRFKTKSDVMFYKAQERIRGYFVKTKGTLSTSRYTNTQQARSESIIQEMKKHLKAHKYHGTYFKRTSSSADKMCNENGWFCCEGEYNNNRCTKGHQINPYSTRDTMVLFSTWNLDHVIEKSRDVIPALRDSIAECSATKAVNWKYFYELLFQRGNLHLVDVRCHDKGRHTGRVDTGRIWKVR